MDVDPIEPTRSKRAIRKDVDIAFVAFALHWLHAYGLHEGGSGIPLDRCVELLKEGKAAGVFPTRDAVQCVVDEIAGAPILPGRRKGEAQ
jgi:hypothetical protein